MSTSSGGWNNSGLDVTEIFDHNLENWLDIQTNLTNDIYSPALNVSLRSGVMSELNGQPVLVGGVECTGYKFGHQTCKRVDKVQALVEVNSGSSSREAKWIELPSQTLSKPKSSHGLLTVPYTYAYGCSEIP